MPGAEAAPASSNSKLVGIVAALGGLLSLASGFLQWGKLEIISPDGFLVADEAIGGFDSSGLFAVIGGIALVIFGVLFFLGIPERLYWAGGAALAGAVVTGAAAFSMIDIQGYAGRYKPIWVDNGISTTGDDLMSATSNGVHLALAAGIISLLAGLAAVAAAKRA